MFHMLTCFNLKEGVGMPDFEAALASFVSHMQEVDLVQSTGPIGERQDDTPMDTDAERDHRYFFTTTFRDRVQCDDAYAYLKSHEEPGYSIHEEVNGRVENPIFICWQDL